MQYVSIKEIPKSKLSSSYSWIARIMAKAGPTEIADCIQLLNLFKNKNLILSLHKNQFCRIIIYEIY